MQNIYAQPGESLQQVGGTCPDGWVQMEDARPDGDYVATESGTWEVPTPTLQDVAAQRLDAYRAESDHLKIEADYNAAVTGDPPDYTAWVSKVAEIKGRYPLPTLEV